MKKGVKARGLIMALVIFTSVCAALVSANFLPESEAENLQGTNHDGLAHAQFSIDKDFCVGSQDDSITSGTYDAYLWYWMDIYNSNDESDTKLSDLIFSVQADNITNVDWSEYAEWNESYAEWSFPPEIVVEENGRFGTGFGTNYSEPKYLNLNITRWFNQTSFNETAYQLVNFSIELEDENFEWLWGGVNANEHSEAYASFVPNTFETDAPIEWIGEGEHEIHFEFDESTLQSGVTYNFSFVVKVEPTMPVVFKPSITIGQGLYHNLTTGETGDTAEMPSYMLPENVSYASVTTNVSNAWSFGRYNHLIASLGEVITPTGPQASFSLHRNFNVNIKDDAITSGTYDAYRGYHLDIYNEDDDSDTALSNLTFTIETENVTGVDWSQYAKWNESYAEWKFPPEFVIEENGNLGTGLGTGYSEPKYLNLNINRWFNQTQFNETGYQLVNFTVEFEDKNFSWLWGSVGAHEHEEVYAAIVPGTFATNAPLDRIAEGEHEVHFDVNKGSLQSGVSYNFSVVINVKPRRPVIYKPDITIGEGLYSNFTTGETGHTVEMPAYMLPENVSYASVSTNISNSWRFLRINHLIAGLTEVVELAGPHAEFHFNRDFTIWTENDTIASGTYESGKDYWLNIENVEDTSGTVLSNLSFNAKAENITHVEWEQFANWNESSADWNFPPYPRFTIGENTGFGTGFRRGLETRAVNLSVSRWLNVTEFNGSGYQLALFNVTFEDTSFEWVWARIEATDHTEVRASIVPYTLTFNAPVNDFNEWDHGIQINFDKNRLEAGVPYNFSVLLKVEPTGTAAPPIFYKPRFSVGEGLSYNSTTGEGYKIEIPPEMLPKNVSYVAASTNVSNAWLIKRHNHIIAELQEVVQLPGPHAEFHFNRDFTIWTENDTIASGTYESGKDYWLNIENVEDTSGTVLSNLSFSAKADTITHVEWEQFAKWNESSAEWNFPPYPRFTIGENTGFGTGFVRGLETRAVNLSVSRWLNVTEFYGSGYQLALFNVTFEDTNFEWVWARIEATDHSEVRASIVPNTFTFNAPVNDFNEWDHGIQINLDKSRLEPGVRYNFSVLIKVEPTGTEAPPILYKPQFSVGEGLYYNSTTGEGYKIEIPPEMLPENVSYAAASTNVSNAWLIKRHNHIIAGLQEVVQLPGPHALFSVDKSFIVMTKSDAIQGGTTEQYLRWGLNIVNSEDTSDTVLGNLRFNALADNITGVRWEEYAAWNKTSVSWAFPSDFIIYEDSGFAPTFGTNHTEVRHVSVDISRQLNQTLVKERAYQLTNFSVTFEDTNFQWCGGVIQANDHDEVNASVVPGTFTTTAPLEWVNEWEHRVEFGFDRARIQIGVPYNCSVVVDVDLPDDVALPIIYKPLFQVNMRLEQSFALGGEGFTIEMPPAMLPNYIYKASATTNVSNTWMLRHINRTTVWLEEVYESPIFDTTPSESPYPSVSGIHNGTITTTCDIPVSKLYTYSCPGTGGHTEYVKIWNSMTGWNVTATWNGYTGDWHNLTFNNSFTLYANATYNYTIRTGSYPQIIHEPSWNATGGKITCTSFVDVNGKRHEDWIPAIRLE